MRRAVLSIVYAIFVTVGLAMLLGLMAEPVAAPFPWQRVAGFGEDDWRMWRRYAADVPDPAEPIYLSRVHETSAGLRMTRLCRAASLFEATQLDVHCVDAGWPLPAFRAVRRSSWRWDTGEKTAVDIGPLVELIPPRYRADGKSPRFVPTTPLWTGLLVDVAFYAGLWWLLAATVIGVRRQVRRRRGQCPRCGHHLAGAPRCPECGWGFPASASESAPSPRTADSG